MKAQLLSPPGEILHHPLAVALFHIRPQLLSAVGHLSTHSRVNKIVLALTHEAASQIKAMIGNIRAGVEHIRGIAPQLKDAQRWYALARYICEKILAFVPHTPA